MKKTIYILIWVMLAISLRMSGQGQKPTFFDRAEFTVEHPDSVNSIASDISPVIVGGQMYYSSVRKSWWNKQSRERKNTAFYNQYQVPLDGENKIREGVGRKLVPGLGEDYHQGPVSYCAATGELFVTESNVSHPDTARRMVPRADIRLKLVIMKQQSGAWKTVSELPFNDKRYHFAHPAISITGDTLVFSSDMPEGKGQSDLYMSVRKGGKWGSPVNLGEQVNTPGNEMFPTFLPGGLLSFSSDGHPGGYGFLDLWYTTFPKPGAVKNAGDKLNTQFDDFGLVVDPKLKVGYLSSNRQGTGSDDIFRIDITIRSRMLAGRVLDAQTGLPIAASQVSILVCNGQELVTVTTDSQGSFRTDIPNNTCLEARAGKEGYIPSSEKVEGKDYIELMLKRADGYRLLVADALGKEALDGVSVSCKDQELGQTNSQGLITLDARKNSGCHLELTANGYLKQTHDYRYRENQGMRVDTVWMYRKEVGKKFVLKNINYDYDKWDILPESKIELDKLVQILTDNPGIRVELGSHTDARGSDAYNRWLSQKRSDSAVGYILSQGIGRNRIKAKGYGETQLINRCKNGVECPDWEHRQNRRTEFKIVGM